MKPWKKRAVALIGGLVLALSSGVPVNAATVTEHCGESHRAQVDPIVSPGVPSAHMHVFFGNTSTNAFGINPSASTTCKEFDDRSAYWVPEVYVNGVPVKLKVAPYWKDDNKNVVAPPVGLSFVTPMNGWGSNVAFACTSGGTTYPTPPNCTGKGKLKMRVSFPACWNGTGTDPSSLVYGAGATVQNGGTCPAGYQRIPRLLLQVDLPISVATGPITLASGDYTTMHADWVNLMPVSQMAGIVARLNG